jgi:hypothetical protein
VDNIRMDLGEVGWSDVDWIGMAQDRDSWRALVNAGKLSSVLATRDLSNSAQLHRVGWLVIEVFFLTGTCVIQFAVCPVHFLQMCWHLYNLSERSDSWRGWTNLYLLLWRDGLVLGTVNSLTSCFICSTEVLVFRMPENRLYFLFQNCWGMNVHSHHPV